MKALISPSPQLPSRLLPHVRPQSPNLTSAVLWGLLTSPPWKISPSSIHSWPALPGLLLSVLEKTRSPARHPRHRRRAPRRLLSHLQLPPLALLLSVLQAQPTPPAMLMSFLLSQVTLPVVLISFLLLVTMPAMLLSLLGSLRGGLQQTGASTPW